MESNQKRDSIAVCLFLVLATLAVYLPLTHSQFVNFDDPEYVSDNPRIQRGFSVETITWAFSSTHAGNWHPLTWLSHMLDWNVFGPNAGGHHLSSVLIHIGSTLLLFFSLRLMTSAVWRSGFVAALFALHPLHVESVAWISERKDVLSAFFWMLTMLFYARYVKLRGNDDRIGRASLWSYGLALVSFGLGLLAKQMLVTLPFALLLLDIWPLQRLHKLAAKPLLKLLFEKIPFFVLTGVFIPIAVWAQNSSHSVVSVTTMPLDQRLENAVVAYFRYFSKTVWPVKLTIFYPYPSVWPAALFACAAIFVLGGLVMSVVQWKRERPLFFVGWSWFMGTLVPVIGLMQIGTQSMADRYSYIPLIGLFMIVAWGGYELLRRVPRYLLVFAPALAIAACMIVTVSQVRYWKDDVSLFEHALAVSENNKLARVNLGSAFLVAGRTNDALQSFMAALEVDPNDPLAHANLAGILVEQGKWDEAALHYEIALRMGPKSAPIHNAAGLALSKQNKLDAAIEHYKAALEAEPDFSKASFNLGNAYFQLGKYDEAISAYEGALEIDPNDSMGHCNLGMALISRERYAEAEAHLQQAIRIRPDFAEAYHNLARACVAQGNNPQKLNEANVYLNQALRLNTNDVVAHFQLANIASGRQDVTNAIAEYRAALKISPDSPEALNNLAWILATSADSNLRNGDEAVRLAEKACNLSGFTKPIFLGTLAAAYAEAGNFQKAVEMGEAAYRLATSAGQTETANKNLELLKLYRAGHRYSDSEGNATKR